MDRRRFLKITGIAAGALAMGGLSSNFVKKAYGVAPPPIPAPTLNPTAIPKYVNALVIPPVYIPVDITDTLGNVIRQDYTISTTAIMQQILPPPLPLTPVWGYQGNAKDAVTGLPLGVIAHSPAASFEATRGIPVNVQWVNGITSPHMFAVDPTLHWANPNMVPMMLMPPFPPFPPGFDGTNFNNLNPNLYNAQSPVPIAAHLHGGETPSAFDGHPDAWFTAGEAIKGPAFSTSLYTYLNSQPAATLWYHDHALGITRLNVMSGLAGFYLLRDKNDPNAALLPKGKYEVPLAIQDRSFNLDGTLFFPSVGLNPTIHPYWVPEFFGNTIMVNGSVWPFLNVDRAIYRFRVLNGSNARFYKLNFSNKMQFLQIGVEGGYLKTPVLMTSLTLAPGERADILVDFTAIAPGTQIILENTAKAPFPRGAPADPQTVGQIMAFNVPVGAPVVTPIATFAQVIAGWTMVLPVLTPDKPDRILTLNEVMGPAGPVEILLNGQKWAAAISELPQVGSTEDWVIVNTTADTHPIHLHLVQFQLVSRQPFQSTKYLNDWMLINGMPPLAAATQVLNPTPYLQGKPVGPDPNEIGWKDTVRMNPGEVTRIRVRFAPLDAVGAAPGVNKYPFDPTEGPGYVWHCHIIDHEDNEMMRPYKVQN